MDNLPIAFSNFEDLVKTLDNHSFERSEFPEINLFKFQRLSFNVGRGEVSTYDVIDFGFDYLPSQNIETFQILDNKTILIGNQKGKFGEDYCTLEFEDYKFSLDPHWEPAEHKFFRKERVLTIQTTEQWANRGRGRGRGRGRR